MQRLKTTEIETPAALVFIDILKRNIKRFADIAKSRTVALRPHIKTHRCAEIMKLQNEAGASGFTVSTLAEAQYAHENGFSDITYAVPIEPFKYIRAFDLYQKGCRLNLLIDSNETADSLDTYCRQNGFTPGVFLKIDCGYHRAGINPNLPESLEKAARIADKKGYNFKGIITHAGHSYYSNTDGEHLKVAKSERDIPLEFAESLEKLGVKVDSVSIGSTPTFAMNIPLDGVSEARPGNYVFFDYTQVRLGSCEKKEVAFYILAAVASKGDNGFIIDAGATALSKDPGPTHIEPGCGFGQVYSLDMQHLGRVRNLSQEHGMLEMPSDIRLNIGDRILIMPNHSCLAAHPFKKYLALENNGNVLEWNKF